MDVLLRAGMETTLAVSPRVASGYPARCVDVPSVIGSIAMVAPLCSGLMIMAASFW